MSSSGIGRDVTRRLGEEMSTAKLSLSPLKGHDGNTAEWHVETDKLIGAKLAVANL